MALLAIPSLAKDGNPTIARQRVVNAARHSAAAKKLHEAKRSMRVAFIATDVRFKRYLAFGDELDAMPGGVLTRLACGGDTNSHRP